MQPGSSSSSSGGSFDIMIEALGTSGSTGTTYADDFQKQTDALSAPELGYYVLVSKSHADACGFQKAITDTISYP